MLIIKMIDYKLLEALAMVIMEGGFDKAAKKLFITQSAVSQRVKLLEDQMGQLLVTRTTPLTATVAGQKLIKHFQKVCILENEIADAIGGERESKNTTISIGVNADSIATWFVEAVKPAVLDRNVLLDIRAEDQEQTHQLLKNGDVIGCISSHAEAFQGCSVDSLGFTKYRLVASPLFMDKWFHSGVTFDQFSIAPGLLFNRKDDLHNKFFDMAFGRRPADIPCHFLPSTEKFVDYITSGIAYGVLMDQQCDQLIKEKKLVELFPSVTIDVNLYWHRWNLSSKVIDGFSKVLIRNAKLMLN